MMTFVRLFLPYDKSWSKTIRLCLIAIICEDLILTQYLMPSEILNRKRVSHTSHV